MLMQIKGIGDNDLTCCEWDGKTLETLEIKVARPYLSRRYVYALSTSPVYTYVDAQKRTVPNGTQTDTHEITAKYNVGDMILAANVHTFEDSSTDALEWEWLDLNMDGRDWARTQTA